MAKAGGHRVERLKVTVIETIVAHARSESPDECCGVLIGSPDAVEEAVATRNIAEQRTTRFLIEPRDHLEAIRSARRRGLDVVGFYHSHPGSHAAPSATDLAEATYPNHLFLIIGLGTDPPDVRLYRFVDRNFFPAPFVTVG